MLKLSTSQIRNKWIEFFKKHDHMFIEPASLIPENDPSILWINSGVATLKDYFSGKENPPANRLVNSQKAIRTNDIFNVGQTSRHHTLFEMLGNFSIGDYFKEKAVDLAYEFLVKELEIDINKLWFTVYEDDEETISYWKKYNIKDERILRCGRDRNFWDIGSGPCGPCTEIHYDRGEKYDPLKIGEKLILEDIENDRFVEIWNIVFSQFNNDGKGNYTELKRKNIDTGAGLERIASISQDVPTNFDADNFQTIIHATEQFSTFKYDINNYFNKDQKQSEINFAYKVIADHFRAAVFAIADGAVPSNKERGYILRRLIRRAAVLAKKLEINDPAWVNAAIDGVVLSMGDFYSYLRTKIIDKVKLILNKEINLFEKTLKQGLSVFEANTKNNSLDKNITFKLVDTYGFPIELIKELAKAKNIEIDLEAFEEMFKQHQLISKNKNTSITALEQQNESLLKLDLESKFYYHTFSIDQAKVIKLYDQNFNEVDQLEYEDGYVVFDQTCFYATSGGQVNDTGYIIADNEKYFVDDVIKAPNLQHVHHTIEAKLALDQIVRLEINKQDRINITANHSAEHLLQYCLRKVISQDIKQDGAAKYPYKVTFDFTHHEPLTKEKIIEVENAMNQIVAEHHEAKELHLSLKEAKEMGAMAFFGEKYKEIKGKLRVMSIGPTLELCGGTHVHNTEDIERVKIIDFSSKGSGSWRITMITRNENLNKYAIDQQTNFKHELTKLSQLIDLTNSSVLDQYNQFINQDEINIDQLDQLTDQFNNLKEELLKLKLEQDKQEAKNSLLAIKKAFNQSTDQIRIQTFKNEDNKIIFNALSELINENLSTVFISFNVVDDAKVQYLLATNEQFAKNNNINLNSWAKNLNVVENTKGGGKPYFVQGGCSSNNALDQFLAISKEFKI